MNRRLNKSLTSLYFHLYKGGHIIESLDLIGIIRLASRSSRKVDYVATNKTKRDSIMEDYFTAEDNNPEKYREKVWNLYYVDIKDVHFERLKKKYEQEGDWISEEEAAARAEERVREMTTKAADKAINSHLSFINEMMHLDPDPNKHIVSPGSGFAHEQVVAPDLKWRGLEYQKNLVDMSNQRNMQLENLNRSERWSILRDIKPGDELGDEWEAKINTIIGDDGQVETVYAKHACGGLSDGVIYDAVKNNVPKLMLATCCANRYPEISWRVLEPKDKDGVEIDLQEYKRVARESGKQGEAGQAACSRIDHWRVEYLQANEYKAERGMTEFGPFIRAIKLED